MTLDYLLNTDWIEIIGFGLLHTSWMILIYSIIAMLVLKSIKESKYKATILLGIMSLSLFTFISLICYKLVSFNPIAGGDISHSIIVQSDSQVASVGFSMLAWLEAHKGILVFTWLIGSIILLCRYLISYGYLAYIKSSATIENSEKINNMIVQLSNSLNYSKRQINLGYSALVNSPIIIGWIKPMIIFPIGLVNLLDEAEVKSIIAHEISHLLRHDQIINFLMSALEIIFYFHPSIWWMNNSMRKYREEACDDQAVAVLSDKMTYIKTLVKLQELTSSTNPHLSVAMKNNESNFYQRIKRLLDMDIQSKNFKTQFLVMTSILLLALMVTQSTLNAREKVNQEDKYEIQLTNESNKDEIEKIGIDNKLTNRFPIRMTNTLSDTIPSKGIKKKSKSRTTVITNDGNESVTLEMEDGQIKRLEVDGKEIPADEYDKYTKEHLDISRFGNSDAMKMYFLEDGEDGDFHFDFPNDLGGLHRLEHNGGFPMNLNIDSLINMQSDSVFAFSFGGDFPHRFEHNLGQYENLLEEFGNKGKMFEELREKGLLLEDERLRIFGLGDEDNIEWRSGPHGLGDNQLRFHFDGEHNGIGGKRTLEDHIGHQLNKDGFLLPNKENKVLLTGKYLKINGEKQPSNIWNKYKSIFENETGVPLSRKSRLEFSIIGKDYGKRYKAF